MQLLGVFIYATIRGLILPSIKIILRFNAFYRMISEFRQKNEKGN